MTYFPTPLPPNTAGWIQTKSYKHMYETQEREMDGVCGNLNRRHWCIVTISHKSLAAAHVTYAHVHVITPGISWHRITILPYRLLHMFLTWHYLRWVFGCMYAGKTTMHQPCHNSLHILYSIQSCNHDLYDLRPYDFSFSSILSWPTQQIH
jgi:hypothetical protein